MKAVRVALALAAPCLAALAVSACAKDPVQALSDVAVRQKVVEAIASDLGMRQQMVDRLVGAPESRGAVLDRVLKDQGAAGDLIKKIIADDRGKALVVAQVTADPATAKAFIRFLMLTGVMGTAVSQAQADAYGLGEVYAFGNRKLTMTELKHIGATIDAFGKEHEGKYPVCYDLANLESCLGKKVPAVASLAQIDAWGTPIQYRSDREGTNYTLISYATDGKWDGMGKVGPTDSYDCDIVFSNGQFIQWPGSIRREDIH